MLYNLKLTDINDLDFITEVRLDPEVQKNVGTFLITNEVKQKNWFEKMKKDDSQEYYTFENEEYTMGYVRVSNIDYINRSMCVGGDIHKDYRGKGLGKEMYDLIFGLGFDIMNMNRLYLLVLETNEIAYNLYYKMGFRTEGKQREAIYKDGKYVDYISMSILKKEYNLKIRENKILEGEK